MTNKGDSDSDSDSEPVGSSHASQGIRPHLDGDPGEQVDTSVGQEAFLVVFVSMRFSSRQQSIKFTDKKKRKEYGMW